MNIASEPGRRQPLPDNENCDRRVVRVIRHREDREVHLGLHTYRGRRYWELATFKLSPGGAKSLAHCTSFSPHSFLEFRAGFEDLEHALREEGEL